METNLHHMNHDMEERLWGYIDGTAAAAEKTVIEKLLATDAAWKEKYSELLEVNQLLQASEMEAPSMRFSKNVMEEIAKYHIAPATKSYINNKIIWGLSFFFIATIVGFLIYGFGQTKWDTGKSSAISEKIDKIDFSQFFNNNLVNAFMVLNIILGLFLLDAFLANKRKQYRNEA